MEKKEKNIIYGRHPLVDAVRSGTQVDKILLQQGIRGEFEKDIRFLGREFNIPVQVVPKERLERLVRGNHQGVIGFLSLIPYYKLEDLLPTIYEKSETPLLLILDGITDVRNLGAIARSAACCGVHGLVIPRKGSAQINAEAIKSSAGALANIPVCRESSLPAAIEFLELSGIQVLASVLKGTKKIYELDLAGPLALIVGSEDKGISPAVRKKVNGLFTIPQKGNIDSFNVSVAAGIMLYEVLRQRGAVDVRMV